MKFRNIILFLALSFQSFNLLSQPRVPSNEIDSIFKKVQISDTDWVIGISKDQAGTIPLFDSLGEPIYSFDYGTILFFKIGHNFFSQKLTYNFLPDTFEPVIVIGNCNKLPGNFDINYTIDSIALMAAEWIYPHIYKNDSLNTYDMQLQGNHSPYYAMYFKVPGKEGIIRRFTDTDLAEKMWFRSSKNLNYHYNSKTFISRCFFKLYGLIDQLKL